MTTSIGLIGVGLMGHGIASNLLRHGFSLGFLQHSGNQPTDDLLDQGAHSCDHIVELAASHDVVITCVTGSPQVEAVIAGDQGVLQGIREGCAIIDCSTAIPSSTRMLAQKAQAAGVSFLDAPMTRTPKEAAEGRLNLIVGGERSVFETHLPVLQAFAENIEYAGPVGSGHTLKLIHNFVSLGFSAVLSEAAACANQSGIDPAILSQVLGKGGGAGVIFDRLKPYVLNQDASSFRFSLSNAGKDCGYYLDMVQQLGSSESLARTVHDLYQAQVDKGNGERVVPELITLLNSGDQ